MKAQRATVEAFVRRARRVESHSLLADREQFVVWAQGTCHVTEHSDGTATLEQEVPDEERFESLAARCRPFLLGREPVHYEKVLNALDGLVDGEPALSQDLSSLREFWGKALERDHPIGFFVRTGRVGGPLGGAVNDGDAAHSWLYSDLVHADPDRDDLDIDTRFTAAVLVYGQIAMATLATLNLIRQARERGVIQIDDACFDRKVRVRSPLRYQLSAMATAPAGTPHEELEEFLDARLREAGEP